MPLYDFRCQVCNEIFEHLETLEDYTGETECPFCGSGAVRVYINAPGIHWSNDAERRKAMLKRRAAEDANKHQKESVEKYKTGEAGKGGGSVFSKKWQDARAKRLGMKSRVIDD